MIKEWINAQNPKDKGEVIESLRDIMQQIALAGLYRAGFFTKAAFYGGTAMRIFYGLTRFSEDLDFSLLKIQKDFKIDPYLNVIIHEFESLGLKVSIKSKQKTVNTAIESAFLKSETLWKEIILEEMIFPYYPEEKLNIKIKIEVDTLPPLGFDTEEKLLLNPFSCYIKCFVATDLFAGKIHALLFRKWKTRVKGRDWFDMEWFIKKGIPLNLHHFTLRAIQSGHLQKGTVMNRDQLTQLLIAKINVVSFERIKEDIVRFIPNPKAISLWSQDYFTELIKQLQVV